MAVIVHEGGIHLIELGKSYSSLEFQDLDALQKTLLELVNEGNPPLWVLDFSQTDYIGSSFLELLFRCSSRLQKRGGKFVLCGLNPFCADVFHVTRLDTLWKVFATRQAAAASLQ